MKILPYKRHHSFELFKQSFNFSVGSTEIVKLKSSYRGRVGQSEAMKT